MKITKRIILPHLLRREKEILSPLSLPSETLFLLYFAEEKRDKGIFFIRKEEKVSSIFLIHVPFYLLLRRDKPFILDPTGIFRPLEFKAPINPPVDDFLDSLKKFSCSPAEEESYLRLLAELHPFFIQPFFSSLTIKGCLIHRTALFRSLVELLPLGKEDEPPSVLPQKLEEEELLREIDKLEALSQHVLNYIQCLSALREALEKKRNQWDSSFATALKEADGNFTQRIEKVREEIEPRIALLEGERESRLKGNRRRIPPQIASLGRRTGEKGNGKVKIRGPGS